MNEYYGKKPSVVIHHHKIQLCKQASQALTEARCYATARMYEDIAKKNAEISPWSLLRMKFISIDSIEDDLAAAENIKEKMDAEEEGSLYQTCSEA